MRTGRLTRLRFAVAILLVVTIGSLLVAGVFAVRRAQHAARLMTAYGHLSQMRSTLQIYESQHGTLPPLCVRNKQGEAIHSWRALIVPHLEMPSLKRLDLSQRWDSAYNRSIVEDTPPSDWGYFARDAIPDRTPIVTHLLAFIGSDSIWNAKTGLPKGTFQRNPDAILLISVPESDIHPLEPRDITEKEVLALIEDGKEVLFIRAGVRDSDGYGVVKIENDKLAFRNWREVHD